MRSYSFLVLMDIIYLADYSIFILVKTLIMLILYIWNLMVRKAI